MSNLNQFPTFYLKRDQVLPFQKISLVKSTYLYNCYVEPLVTLSCCLFPNYGCLNFSVYIMFIKWSDLNLKQEEKKAHVGSSLQ